jgi:hypothetical protein
VIPRRLVRTVPAEPAPEAEAFWGRFGALHPGWELVTWRDPVPRRWFPTTWRLWDHCTSGAQRAGLIRLEDLALRGGVYVDSDVEPLRPLGPLLGAGCFAAWEDARVVPDAVLGAEAGHPAVLSCLSRALGVVAGGGGAWESGPGVTTAVLPGRDDVLLLPPGAFFPVHYREKHRLAPGGPPDAPWAFAQHWWAGSWLTPEQKAQISRRWADRRRGRG